MEYAVEYVVNIIFGIGITIIGWKLANSKIDPKSLKPGFTMAEATRKRKRSGYVAVVIGVFYFLVSSLMLFSYLQSA